MPEKDSSRAAGLRQRRHSIDGAETEKWPYTRVNVDEHWIRALLGAGVSLLAALVTAVARALLRRRSRPSNESPSESTDVVTFKFERHREVHPPQGEHTGPPGTRTDDSGAADREDKNGHAA